MIPSGIGWIGMPSAVLLSLISGGIREIGMLSMCSARPRRRLLNPRYRLSHWLWYAQHWLGRGYFSMASRFMLLNFSAL
ncbi:hypothetical protein BT96DRAFT_913864, partial [Gymnopus androsaceus JB14]